MDETAAQSPGNSLAPLPPHDAAVVVHPVEPSFDSQTQPQTNDNPQDQVHMDDLERMMDVEELIVEVTQEIEMEQAQAQAQDQEQLHGQGEEEDEQVGNYTADMDIDQSMEMDTFTQPNNNAVQPTPNSPPLNPSPAPTPTLTATSTDTRPNKKDLPSRWQMARDSTPSAESASMVGTGAGREGGAGKKKSSSFKAGQRNRQLHPYASFAGRRGTFGGEPGRETGEGERNRGLRLGTGTGSGFDLDLGASVSDTTMRRYHSLQAELPAQPTLSPPTQPRAQTHTNHSQYFPHKALEDYLDPRPSYLIAKPSTSSMNSTTTYSRSLHLAPPPPIAAITHKSQEKLDRFVPLKIDNASLTHNDEINQAAYDAAFEGWCERAGRRIPKLWPVKAWGLSFPLSQLGQGSEGEELRSGLGMTAADILKNEELVNIIAEYMVFIDSPPLDLFAQPLQVEPDGKKCIDCGGWVWGEGVKESVASTDLTGIELKSGLGSRLGHICRWDKRSPETRIFLKIWYTALGPHQRTALYRMKRVEQADSVPPAMPVFFGPEIGSKSEMRGARREARAEADKRRVRDMEDVERRMKVVEDRERDVAYRERQLRGTEEHLWQMKGELQQIADTQEIRWNELIRNQTSLIMAKAKLSRESWEMDMRGKRLREEGDENERAGRRNREEGWRLARDGIEEMKRSGVGVGPDRIVRPLGVRSSVALDDRSAEDNRMQVDDTTAEGMGSVPSYRRGKRQPGRDVCTVGVRGREEEEDDD